MPANTHAEKSAAAKGLPPFRRLCGFCVPFGIPENGRCEKEDKNIDVKRNIP